jgi:long-chain acyl-CoA synthetase
MRVQGTDNFYDLFAAVAHRVPLHAAVEVQRRDRVDSFDFVTLEGMAERIGGALREAGVGPRERCTILADNDERWCAAYLGVLRVGAIAVPLDTAYRAAQLRTIVSDCEARVAFVSSRYLPTFEEACEGLPQPPAVMVLAGAGGNRPGLDDILRNSQPPVLAPCPSQADDTAVILYTSGTTSDPKGVMLTHRNLLAERDAALQIVDLTERDSILGVLPLFHALAQVANLLLPLTVGARVVFLETLTTGEILRGLAEREVTAFCCVPQFYYLIHERVTERIDASAFPLRWLTRLLMRLNGWLRRVAHVNAGALLFAKVHRALGPRMRILVSGGSRLDPGVGQSLYRLGFNLIQAYGLTECSGAATVTRQGDDHLESVGQPIAGVEVRIAPHEGSAGDREQEDGEILIRGPIVMKGYYERPEATAASIEDGWLHSGDLGFLDQSGRLHVTGRKKEVIVLASGKNIYPEEVEAYYATSSIIKDICVMGISRPEEPSSERLHAIVVPNQEVLRERKVVNVRDLLRFEIEGISIRLPAHKRVLSFDVWQDDLPRTTTRKLKRFEIERIYRARATEAAQPPAAPPLTEAEQLWAAEPEVARALVLVRAAAKPGSIVVPSANLDLDLGLDSMERVELLTSLELLFGTDVTEEASQRILTVRQLVEAVRGPLRAERGTTDSAADPWERLLAEGPDDPLLRGILVSRPLFVPVAWLIMKLVGLVARMLIGLRTSGQEHIPAKGPFLISPNHQSYIDAFVMVSALPFRTFRQVFFVGATEYFETPFMRWLASFLNVVPVDPDANLVRAMQAGASGLRHGKVLVLFPEGERSPDGSVKRFKKGAAILSIHLGVPIVPVAIEGAFEVWPRNQPFNWRGMWPVSRTGVHVEFGPPLNPEAVSAERPEERYAALTERFRAGVEAMWVALRRRRLGGPQA